MIQEPGKKVIFNKTFKFGKHQITHEFNGEVIRIITIKQSERKKLITCDMTLFLMEGFATTTNITGTTSTTTTSSTTTGIVERTLSVCSKQFKLYMFEIIATFNKFFKI